MPRFDPLTLLRLPKDEDGRQVEAPVAQNIYRSKGDCVTRFERLMSSPDVTVLARTATAATSSPTRFRARSRSPLTCSGSAT